MLGVLYDIHGNLPALEAVLEQAEDEGADRWLLGGDYGTPSPWPHETLARLRGLDRATWIRGNGERWLREPPERPEVAEEYERFLRDFPQEEVERLYRLAAQAELDGVLYVHGSPLADDDTFAPAPQDGEERLLAGVRDRLVVFGHSHQQFRRSGPSGTELLNPGSVGMPLDRDRRAAWAVRDDDGEFHFRRTEYDVERAAHAYRAMRSGFGEMAAGRIERGSD